MKLKQEYTGLEIAIIGMSGRVPNARDLEQFWENLINNNESLTKFDDEELLKSGVHPNLLQDENYVKVKGIFPAIDEFDNEFFNYTPRDASLMDPQTRALHEEVYHALENAGYGSEDFRESTGVFLGASNNLAWEIDTLKNTFDNDTYAHATMQLNDKDFAATLIAYSLNLQGPSFTVHSACSTSLYAIDIACRYLLTGACTMAVAGGSGFSIPSKNGYVSKNTFFSPDGQCRPFDKDAKGTVEGNGAGIVVLKLLEDAIEDRDHIHAVIRATASNNDGHRKLGFTAPSVEGQAEVINKALAMAEVDLDSISYIETHGTGTNLGDPIEVAALSRAYRSSKYGSIGIGSLKANIGHLDVAAGISSLLKTTLALKHKKIPASINFNELNPEINHPQFRVVTENEEWKRKVASEIDELYVPLRAGLSSFGLGGTNVHMILEESPLREPSGKGRDWNLFTLSAHNELALDRMKKHYLDFLNKNGKDLHPADLAWSMKTSQKEMSVRYTLPYKNIDDLKEKLGKGQVTHKEVKHDNPNVYFLFPGYGSQYIGMAKELYRTEPFFSQEVEKLLAIAEEKGIFEIRKILLHSTQEDEDSLNEIDIAQLALFIVEYALARTLINWGVHPSGMIGHSLGEYVAACLSGVFSPEEGIELVVSRGRIMKSMPRGAMITVNAPVHKFEHLLTEDLSIAAINSNEKCTVSGTVNGIAELRKALTKEKILSIPLKTNHAAHSVLMEAAMEPYEEICATITFNKPRIPYISDITGDWVEDEQVISPSYYANHLRSCVQFAKGVKKILEDKRAILVEVGPGNILSTFARQTANDPTVSYINTLPDPLEEISEETYLVDRIGNLWSNGVTINWKTYYKGQERNRVPLPKYSFDSKKFPIGNRDLMSLLMDTTSVKQPSYEFDQDIERFSDKEEVKAAEENHEEVVVGHFDWESTFIPAISNEVSRKKSFVFTDRVTTLKKLMRNLPLMRSIIIKSGEQYNYAGTLESEYGSGSVEDVIRLLEEFSNQALLPDTIIFSLSTEEQSIIELKTVLTAWDEERLGSIPTIVILAPYLKNKKVSKLLTLSRGLKTENENLNLKIIDVGVPISQLKHHKFIADTIERELHQDSGRFDMFVKENRQKTIQRFRPIDINLGNTSDAFSGKQIIVTCPEQQILNCDLLIREEEINSHIYVLPYRLENDKKVPSQLSQRLFNRSNITMLPVVELKELQSGHLPTPLTDLRNIGGIIHWDKQILNNESVVLQFIKYLAEELSRPQVVVSVLPQHYQWNSATTDWLMSHEDIDISLNNYRIYLHDEFSVSTNKLFQIMGSMISSRIKSLIVNPNGHPFWNYELENNQAAEKLVVDSELEKIQHLLQNQWSKLFGYKQVDLDVNFFELGGDSFKLIQISSELESKGYKVLMNEMYKYPTIRSLSAYIYEKSMDESNTFNGVYDIETKLFELTGQKSRYCKLLNGDAGYVLFIEELSEVDKSELLMQLRNLNVPKEYIPQYMFPIRSIEMVPAEISIEELGRLENKIDTSFLQEIDVKIEVGLKKFQHQIVSQPVIKRYGISKIQQMNFNGEVRLQLYLIEFNEMIDVKLLERAFCDVVGSHGLLRSCLYKQNDSLKWKEHAPPQEISLPFIDISHVTPEVQEEVLSFLAKREWSSDFKIFDSPMYHVMLIKRNELSYDILFQFDHSIIDLSSGQLIRRHLTRRYRELARGYRQAMEASPSYEDYVNQVVQGPIGISEEQLISSFDLDQYGSQLEIVMEKLWDRKTGRIDTIHFDLDLDDFKLDGVEQDDPFEIALQVYILVLSRILNVEAIPFDLISMNRRYGKKDYSDMVGLILDTIPLLIPVDRETPSNMTKLIKERIALIHKHNINFLNLPAKGWQSLNEMFNANKLYSPLLLNYAGLVEADYDKVMKLSMEQLNNGEEESQEKLNYGEFYGLVKVINNKINFVVLSQIKPVTGSVEEIFEEEVQHLMQIQKSIMKQKV